MKIHKINSIYRYDEIVESYNLRGCYSNNYMLRQEVCEHIDRGNLYEECTINNAYFLLQKPRCLRVYYYLNDVNDIVSFDRENFAIEILYRGEVFYPQKEIRFFQKSGFSVNLIRDQYSGLYKDFTPAECPQGIIIESANTIEQVEFACNLFNRSFDKYTGDFIHETDFDRLKTTNAIIIARKEKTLLGALHQTIEKNVAWISHIAVEPSARGQHIGQALIDYYIEMNKVSEKSRYMLWVQQQNTPAINMYRKKGFKYINKSTVSLLKINK